MALTPGTRLGPYEIVAPLGAGGMGAVYRATDTRLNRTVAIKSMHASGALDPDQIARFEREAQLLASLNHPNIAAIHGLETVEATTYLVLEFVDGRPLADMLREGAMPIGEALPIARQIADALAATHERGIIHRDLKPGNVMVTPDGQVKVLDFGLGKTLDPSGAADATPHGQANSPTMTLAATQAGIILGTAGYMSPEQAKGRTADKRSDVWAFGCVLFEMLSGRRAFDGEDITETLAAIVRGEPDWQALPAGIPPAIRTLIERCLVKNRAERLPDMSVVKFVLNEPGTLGAQAAVPAVAHRGMSLPVAAAVAVIALVAGAWGMRLWSGQGTAGRTPTALAVTLPDGNSLAATAIVRPLAISRDGQQIAFVGDHDGVSQLFVRALSDATPHPLPGTQGASMPFFSHDGKWIGFFAQGQMKRISTDGAGLQPITPDVPSARGAYWAADDTIYFARNTFSGLVSVPASGGAPTPVTTLDAGEVSHRWPFLLPDGRTLLFTIWTGPGHDEHSAAVVTLGAQGSSRHVVLLPGADTAQYFDGHLLYGRDGRLFSLPWELGPGDLSRAVPLAQNVFPRFERESTLYAVSENGTLIFAEGDPDTRRDRVVWVNRVGQVTALPLALDNYTNVILSPDGASAVLEIGKGVQTLWIYDLARNTLTPLTPPDASSQAPIWSVDGQFVIYRGTREGTRNLYRRRADGTGNEERLTTAEGVTQTPTSVSPDGEWLVFSDGGASGAFALKALHLTGDRETKELLAQESALVQDGQISPDGRWLAYRSNRSGRSEVYVQPFPEPGPATPVSVDGGTEPRWSRDGRELYYVPASGDRLMVVAVPPTRSWEGSTPKVLFEGTYKPNSNGNTPYDVAPDGRFIRIQTTRMDGPISRIEVILNWTPVGK